MTQQEVGRVAVRAHMVLLSSREFTVPEISNIYRISDTTIYNWFDRFDEEGPPGLYDQPRSGRPPKMNEEVKKQLEDAVTQSPTELGYNFTRWTVPLLGQHLLRTVEEEFCQETIRNTLRKLGFRWRRPRWAAPQNDPQGPQIMKSICRAILSAEPQTAILLEDETTFKLLPPLRQMWMRVGEQVRIPTPSQNDDLHLYGALELHTGECVRSYFPKSNSDHTITFLEHLYQSFSKHILLIWDQARYHTSKKVQCWLDEHPRITAMLLPKKSPQLNPTEMIWRHLKDRVAANLTRTLEAIRSACETSFQQLSSSNLLQMAGLLYS